jgi:TPP-dependent pyruvate/acetoin dehydrogenase alpha subunit
VFKAPTIFVCENNQYAISLHVTKQTASKNIAMKAEAYGFEGIPVDGNDLVAVHQAVSQAREKAAKGEGPTLIECYTYRISDHSTSDDAKRYRKDDEIQFWKQRDPVRRLFLYLQKRGLWGEKKEASLKAELESKVNAALAESERIGPPDKDSMLTDIYAGNPTNLRFSDLE